MSSEHNVYILSQEIKRMDKRQVLVVDDSKTMRDMITHTLHTIGFDVTDAEDGQDALNVVSQKDQPFDVVITDINMPKVGGIELIKKLRASDHYKFTPILVITTEGGEDIKKEGKQAGATGWIVKPFDPDKLIQVLEKVA